MKIATVVLDIPAQGLDTPYSYLVPAMLDRIEVGHCVVVPFGRRKAVGFVASLEEATPATQAFDGVPLARMKPIEQVVGSPYFDKDGAACAFYLAKSCIAPLSSCFRLLTPPGGVPKCVKSENGWEVRQPEVGAVDDRYVRLTPDAASYQPPANATRQQALLQALAAGELRMAELSLEFGAASATVAALERRGVVEVEHRRRMRSADIGGEWKAPTSSERPHLTPGQQAALEAIREAQGHSDGHVVLVDGVTGSGKTEVYLQAIEPMLAQGKRAIVLVPEISLTPQTVARFRSRFGDAVAVMHSRMSQGERYDQWDFIRSGDAKVVVGARSALFTPVRDLGIVVIDEEHESSYKQDQAPRYHAREVAQWLAKRHGATLVLGSATPSIETLHACATNKEFTRVALSERANGKPLPEVTVVDMAREFRGGSRSMFSHALASKLENTLKQGRKAILMLNQRGFAKFVLCRDCGYVPECPHCATSLTYHEHEGLLTCHHCGYAQVVNVQCPQCASPYLKKFGAGTQRVEAELRQLVDSFGIEGVRIIRMDADTTRAKGAHGKLLEEFRQPGAAVLLGTQMIAKGLDFEDVTLVGVVNADTTLKVPDFRSAERTYSLIEQVAGRAGRAELPGTVVVQTYWAESTAIQAAARHDRALFLREELPKRRMLGYPPYVGMANILVWGKNEGEVMEEASRLYRGALDCLRESRESGWTVLPATPCALAKLRDTYRWHILVKAPPEADMAGVLHSLMARHQANPNCPVAVDIGPASLV